MLEVNKFPVWFG